FPSLAGTDLQAALKGTDVVRQRLWAQYTERPKCRELGRLFAEKLVGLVGAGARGERRLDPLLDRLLRDRALGDVLAGGQLEHHVEQCGLDDRTQAAGAGLALQGAIGDRPGGVGGEG